MVTKEQKKVFKDSLNTIFNENIQQNEETYKKYSQWFKNLYYRCINNTLPKEHIIVFEKRLTKRQITVDEFLKTKGNLELFISLYKSKNKEDSKEEIDTLLNELEEEIISLESKITKRNRSLYKLTDEACKEIEKQINELKEKRKELNEKLKAMESKEENIEKESQAANKKIEELIISNKEKDAEIINLKNEIAKQREERAFYSNKYREEFEKKFEIYSREKDEEVAEKVKDEVRKHNNKVMIRDEENKHIQKKHIRNLLLTENIVSLDDIKFKLKTAGVSTSKIDIAINELRNEIPGIVRVLNQDGKLECFSLSANATNRLDALKNIKVCPRISNVMTGTIKYIIRADLHISLNSTEDDIKKILEPYFEYSTVNKNLPILDLGDVPDTLETIERSKWVSGNKEAAKLVYDFFKNYTKIIATVPSIKHYQQTGNHDDHAFLVGIDPLEIMATNSTNIISLGVEKGAYMIGNDKIGVFHGINNISHMHRRSIEKFRENLCKAIDEELPQITSDEIYSFISHYHTGMHKPLQHYSLVSNNEPLLITTEVEDGTITKMYVQKLLLSKTENTFVIDSYPIEIYNSGYQYTK